MWKSPAHSGPELYQKDRWASKESQKAAFFQGFYSSYCLQIPALNSCLGFPGWWTVPCKSNKLFPPEVGFSPLYYSSRKASYSTCIFPLKAYWQHDMMYLFPSDCMTSWELRFAATSQHQERVSYYSLGSSQDQNLASKTLQKAYCFHTIIKSKILNKTVYQGPSAFWKILQMNMSFCARAER